MSDSLLHVTYDAGRTVHSHAVTKGIRSDRPRSEGATHPRMQSVLGNKESLRLTLAVILTILYVALSVGMFYIILNPAKVTMQAAWSGDRLEVTWILPAGNLFEQGVRANDIVTGLDGKAPKPGGPVPDFSEYSTVTIQQAKSGATLGPLSLNPTDNSPMQGLMFAFLGLIFVGVGGPVFVKAKQRTAASAFYVFCLSTAVSLALSAGIASNVAWVQALLFVSLIVFSGSFAFFFLNFPVSVGKTERRHTMLLASVVLGSLIPLLCYAWVLSGHPSDYTWVRLLMIGYLAVCVGAGVASLGASLRRQKSPEIRQQLVLLLGGTAFAVGPSLLLSVIPQMFYGEIVSIYFTAFSLCLMPLAFAYAITQHQLLGIRGFVRRSVVYVVMGSSVLLVFAIAASALSSVTKGWATDQLGLIGFGFFVFLIAFSFGFLQRKVEHYVDRFIYHDAYDYKEALLEFSSQLASQQDLNVLASQLVERTCRLMNLVCGVLVLAVNQDDERALPGYSDHNYSNGTRPDDARTTAPLNGASTATYGRVVDGATWLSELMPASGKGARNARRDVGPAVTLQVYAKYGRTADLMIAGLQDELSRLGVSLHRPDGSLVPLIAGTTTGDLRAQARGHSGLVEANASPVVGSIVDAVASTGVTEILSTRPLTSADAEGAADLARSFLGVPLWTRSRFVGVLCLAGKKTGERFTKDDLSLLSTLGSQAALAVYNAQLSEAREQALLDTIAALAHSIEAKDGYTSEHCEKMTDRAVAVAQALGLSRQEVENVRLGAILHDIGKIGIPDAVLNKPGKLTPEEYEVIKQHAQIGAEIVQPVKALQGVVPIIMHHQERYDGTGYPLGLRGEDIPLGARIIGVVDTYGAMTEDRVYRKAPGHERAVSELKLLAGRQFDPNVVEAFLSVLEEHPELGEGHVPHSKVS